MSSKYKRKWLSLTAALFLVTPVVQLSTPAEVQAVADTFTLTAISDDVISVQLNGTPQVRLPGGTITTTNTTYRVTKNNTYTFVGIDGEVKSQKSITMTNVPNQPPLLIVSPGENVKLRFESEDAHSGVKEMRYKIYNEISGAGSANFTAWETYKTVKDYVIPSIPNSTNSYWVVEAEFRDVAGNVKNSIITRFMIENWAPEVSLDATDEWINKDEFESNQQRIKAIGTSQFGQPVRIQYGVAKDTFVKWDTTVSFNRPSLPSGYSETKDGDILSFNYESASYALPINTDGYFNVFMQVAKQSNNREILSNVVSKRIGLDTASPTGSIQINDGEEAVPSTDVTLNFTADDSLSGVENIKICEVNVDTGETMTDKCKSASVTDTQIDWSFGDTIISGQVEMTVTDKAGNTTVERSQPVIFAKLAIDNIKLTKNRNPQKYKDGFEEKSWQWKGEEETMLAGSNFEFEFGYNVGVANIDDYELTDKSKVKVYFGNGDTPVIYDVELIPGKKATLRPVNKSVAPKDQNKILLDKSLSPQTNVFVEIELEVQKISNGRKLPSETTGKLLFGKIGDKSLDDVVNEAIQFNEVN